MAPQSLYTLLNSCVVFVAVPAKRAKGTGFFVAPGKILTCAHVVEAAQQQQLAVEITWNGQTLPAHIREFCDPPDLALLEVELTNHPCVLLYGGAEPEDHLYSFGFPDIEPTGASTTFRSEGWVGDQLEQLRLKEGQGRPGMSGSPLLNLDSGSVCGIVQETRDRNSDLGGKALSTQVIFREFPDLEEQQKQYHQQHREWLDSMTPQQRQKAGLAMSTPVPNTKETFEIFYSYAEEDEQLVKELQKQLILLKRRNLITDWHAGKIVLQEEPTQQIMSHLNSARIILLLISPDFMVSEQQYNIEVMRAMERHEDPQDKAIVVPILLRPTDDLQDAPFGGLQAIPRNRKPISTWSNRDEAFAEVAREIRQVVEDLKKQANPQSAH